VRTTGEKIPDSARSKRVVYRSKRAFLFFYVFGRTRRRQPMPVVWHSRPTGRYDSSFSALERHPGEGFLPGNKTLSVTLPIAVDLNHIFSLLIESPRV
jgi:hypothetical protein